MSAMLLYSANGAGAANVADSGKRVIVIDPGHGGDKYPGAVYGGYKEKDINLQVALKLKKLLDDRLPDFTVRITRTSDKYLNADKNVDLRMRADMANDAKAVMFVSIHANAVEGNTTACGTETHVLGEDERSMQMNYNAIKGRSLEEEGEIIDMSDASVAALERAVIESRQLINGAYNKALASIIERNYSAAGMKSRGMRQSPWAVLRNITMPGVLTEIGYMTNSADLAYITSEKGQMQIAEALAKSIVEYLDLIDRVAGGGSDTVAAGKSESVEDAAAGTGADASSPSGYTIQLVASANKVSVNDSEFKSYRGRVMILTGSGALKYKYCFGTYESMAAAKKDLRQIQKEFKDAYIVEFEGGRIK